MAELPKRLPQYIPSSSIAAPFTAGKRTVDITQFQKVTGYNPNYYYNDAALSNYAGEVQTGWQTFKYALGRTGVTTIATLGQMFASLAPGATGTYTGFNNDFSNTLMSSIDKWETNQKEKMPVFWRDNIRNGTLWENMTAGEFWADEGAQGFGMFLGMMLPALVGRVPIPTQLLGRTALAAGAEGAAVAAQTTRMTGIAAMKAALKGTNPAYTSLRQQYMKLLMNGYRKIRPSHLLSAQTASNISLGTYTALQTVSEAGLETFHLNKELNEAYMENVWVGRINPETGQRWTKEDAQEKLNTASNSIFLDNLAILALSNTVMNSIFFGGTFGKRAGNRFRARTQAKGLKARKRDFLYDGLTLAGISSFTEGFWEEGMQTAAEMKAKSLTSMDSKGQYVNFPFLGAFDAYGDMLGTTEGAKSVFLGSVIGIVGSTGGHIINRKQHAKYIKDVITARDNLAEIAKFKRLDPFERNPDGSIVKDAQGLPKRSENAIMFSKVFAAFDAHFKMQFEDALMEAAENGNTEQFDKIFDKFLTQYAMQYIANPELSKYLKEDMEAAIQNWGEQAGMNYSKEQMKQKISKANKTAARVHKSAQKYSDNANLLFEKAQAKFPQLTKPMWDNFIGTMYGAIAHTEIAIEALEELKQTRTSEGFDVKLIDSNLETLNNRMKYYKSLDALAYGEYASQTKTIDEVVAKYSKKQSAPAIASTPPATPGENAKPKVETPVEATTEEVTPEETDPNKEVTPQEAFEADLEDFIAVFTKEMAVIEDLMSSMKEDERMNIFRNFAGAEVVMDNVRVTEVKGKTRVYSGKFKVTGHPKLNGKTLVFRKLEDGKVEFAVFEKNKEVGTAIMENYSLTYDGETVGMKSVKFSLVESVVKASGQAFIQETASDILKLNSETQAAIKQLEKNLKERAEAIEKLRKNKVLSEVDVDSLEKELADLMIQYEKLFELSKTPDITSNSKALTDKQIMDLFDLADIMAKTNAKTIDAIADKINNLNQLYEDFRIRLNSIPGVTQFITDSERFNYLQDTLKEIEALSNTIANLIATNTYIVNNEETIVDAVFEIITNGEWKNHQKNVKELNDAIDAVNKILDKQTDIRTVVPMQLEHGVEVREEFQNDLMKGRLDSLELIAQVDSESGETFFVIKDKEEVVATSKSKVFKNGALYKINSKDKTLSMNRTGFSKFSKIAKSNISKVGVTNGIKVTKQGKPIIFPKSKSVTTEELVFINAAGKEITVSKAEFDIHANDYTWWAEKELILQADTFSVNVIVEPAKTDNSITIRDISSGTIYTTGFNSSNKIEVPQNAPVEIEALIESLNASSVTNMQQMLDWRELNANLGANYSISIAKAKPVVNNDFFDDAPPAIENKDENDENCAIGGGPGTPKAKDGMTNANYGTNWKIVKDLKGLPKHSQGGVDLSFDNGKVSFTRKDGKIHAAHGLFINKNEE